MTLILNQPPCRPVAIIGFGGHARVVCAALRAMNVSPILATDRDPSAVSTQPFPVVTDEELIANYTADSIDLVLGIGSISISNNNSPNQRAVRFFEDKGYRFVGFQHPSAWVAHDAEIGVAAQVHAGAIVQAGAHLANHAVVNSRASVDHDCHIGSFCHVAPGATLSGDVHVGNGSLIGTGASIIQGIKVGKRSLVAAGSTVVQNVGDEERVKGTPARRF